jgi:hypothetical protein
LNSSDLLNIAKQIKNDEEKVTKNKKDVLDSSKQIETMLSEPKTPRRRTKKNDVV